MNGLSMTKCEATLYAIAVVCIKTLELGNFLSELDSILPTPRGFWNLRLKGRTDTGTEIEVLAAMEFVFDGSNPYNFTQARVHVSHRKRNEGNGWNDEFRGVDLEVAYAPEHGIVMKTPAGAQS